MSAGRGLALAAAVMLIASHAAAEPRPSQAPAVVDAKESTPVPPTDCLLDEDGILGDAGATLRGQLEAASRRAGVSISVAVVGRLASHHSSVEELTSRLFAERGLSDAGHDAVLLLVAPRLGRAAIETGKGPAGIVPEIDARRITSELRHTLGRKTGGPAALGRSLGGAVDAIAASALATLERRRPLAREERSENDEGPAPPLPDARPPPSEPAAAGKGGRSILPAAGALCGLVMLGLGLRQRRRDQTDRAPAPRSKL